MIERPIDNVSATDLASLVANKVAEGRSLEFKQCLPGGSDTATKEFLADVTSLANAHGGDLIFGIKATDGVASEVVGLQETNPDEVILRLENILRDGIEPRLSGVRLHWIPLEGQDGGLIIRVPASLAAPHRIRFKNSGRFYTRNSRGKYEMDTHELRIAFTAADGLPAKLRSLHAEAVSAAEGQDMPFTLNAEPSAVVSVIPLSFLREPRDLPITEVEALAPARVSGGLDWLYTIEGVLMHTPLTDSNSVRSYALTHRAGRVDAAWTIGGVREGRDGSARLVWPKYFEGGLLDMAGSTVSKLRPFGVEGPWVVFTTVFGVRGSAFHLSNDYRSRPAWRNQATLPQIIADHLDVDTLLPVIRAFWLLFGEVRPDRPVPYD